MFIHDRNAVDNLRSKGDADLFWIAITAVIAFTTLFSGILTTI